ncbi:MAG: chromosomal replication initiator protein [Patescibacteria group bacterium]|nr:chromosomal replication initiator protein [Patescibacteria group bacterium]
MDQQDLSLVWQGVLEEVQKELSEANFKTWFLSTRLDTIETDPVKAIITTPNNFVSKNLQERYSAKILKLLQKNYPSSSVTELEFKVAGTKRSSARKNTATGNDQPDNSRAGYRSNSRSSFTSSSSQKKQDPRGIVLPINPKYTFGNFVVGSSNELAYTVAQAIAKEPGQRFNPLFIYGGVGLGKTHLMQAVANAILETHPEKNVVYTSTQTYVNDFLDSIRNKATSNFIETYNNADVLVIDDIQFIAGKDKTMEEFFHTFNILHQNNKQIILSADQPPRSIPTLPDRLRSRFEWGMTVDVQSPDFETRCAIIQSKAKAQNVELDYESVEFIASNIKNNIRELEGAINQILVLCQVQNLKPDLELVKSILKSATKTPKRFTYQHITAVCCEHFGIEESDVLSARRDKEIALTRQIAMYLMRTELKLSLPKIASALGRKDHTTAMHSINKITNNLDEDFNLRRHVGAIRQKLYEQ